MFLGLFVRLMVLAGAHLSSDFSPQLSPAPDDDEETMIRITLAGVYIAWHGSF